MTNSSVALARRFWIHVHEGGTLTSVDVGRMVTAMEEQDAAFTNLHREYDRRGDRIEELEAKLDQQDDLVQAAVAAALREAADAVEDYCSDAPDLAGHGHSGAIRDVITAIRKGGK